MLVAEDSLVGAELQFSVVSSVKLLPSGLSVPVYRDTELLILFSQPLSSFSTSCMFSPQESAVDHSSELLLHEQREPGVAVH